MSRIALPVKMELMSDAVFGTGYSVPGGEDMDVCRDRHGWPYLKGTSLKGLLRESVQNWLTWSNGPQQDVEILFGTEGWSGQTDPRRIQFTALELIDPPAAPEQCFGSRAFTQIEDGLVKEGTLREAVCVRRGLCFSGTLFCAEGDEALVKNALSSIRWAGSMRNRGFGRVRFSVGEKQAIDKEKTGITTSCIHYSLYTKSPVIVTHLGRSYGNSYETRDYIPGAAIRGMVLGTLAAHQPEWFQSHRAKLLSDVTFLDAVPSLDHRPGLPVIKGFYEKKDETGFTSVLLNPDLPDGLKRAKMGSFCTIEQSKIRCWKGETGGGTRIRRGSQQEDSKPFETRYLEAGQMLDGYVRTDDLELGERISSVLSGEVWLGADRYEGYGHCVSEIIDGQANVPAWETEFGYSQGQKTDSVLYLLALSPLTMLDEWGEPNGLDERELARLLDIERIRVDVCSTSMSEYGGYNRVRQCREPSVRMYDQGSIFRLVCDHGPKAEKLIRLQHDGLGIRTNEGYGQVLFLRRELYEGIAEKENIKLDEAGGRTKTAKLRRARYRWISNTCKNNMSRQSLSPSQLGSVQALCEKSIVLGGNTKELMVMLDHNIQDRDRDTCDKFTKIKSLILDVLERPLSATLNVSCADSLIERLKLLVELFDHSRKEQMMHSSKPKGGRRI